MTTGEALENLTKAGILKMILKKKTLNSSSVFACNLQPTYLGNFKIQPLSAVTIKSLQNVMESNLTPLNLHTLIKKALTDLTMFLIHYLKTQVVPRLKNSPHWGGGKRDREEEEEEERKRRKQLILP